MPDTNPPWWSWLPPWLTAANSGVDPGSYYGVPIPGAPAQAPDVYAHPQVPPAQVPDVYAHPQILRTQARSYRAQHGLAASDDAATDALNAESLAAAQAGRTYFNPTLAAQYGQPLPAGVSGPRTDVVNALTMPPGAAQTAVAQQPPAVLAQNNLLAQGIY